MPAGYGLSRSAKPAQSLLSTFHKGKRVTGNQGSPPPSKLPASKKKLKIPDDFAPPMSTDDEEEDDGARTVPPTKKSPNVGRDVKLDLLAHSSGDDELAARTAISKTSWRSNRATRSTRNNDLSEPDGSASSPASKRGRRGAEPTNPKRQKVIGSESTQNHPVKSSQDLPTSSSSQSTNAALFGRRHASAKTFGKRGADPRKSRIRQPTRSQWRHKDQEEDDTLPSDPEDTTKKPLKTVGDLSDTPDRLTKKQTQRGLQVVSDIDDDLFNSPQKQPSKLKVRQRAGTDELLASPPKEALQESTTNTRGTSRKNTKGKRKLKSPTPEPELPKPRFKAPVMINDYFEASDGLDGLDGKDNLAPWSSDAENSDARERLSPVLEVPSEPVPAKCPWCGEAVSASLLADYSKGKPRLKVNLQRKFCQIHKKSTALQTWEDMGYPKITWDALTARFDGHLDHLLSVIKDKEPSHFRSFLAKQIEEGRSRALRQEDNLNPGYYGPKGFQLMCDYLVDNFQEQLKERAVIDPVIRGRGSAAFIQTVLVPELGVRLIMEDMDLDEEAAMQVLEESKSLGEIVSEEA